MALNESFFLNGVPKIVQSALRSPRTVTLHTGEALFRFASTDNNSTKWAGGAWWIRESDYYQINSRYEAGRRQHKEDALTFGFIARGALAVKPSWSRLDVVVKALVLQDINAFEGVGQTQRDELDNGIQITLPGWPSISHLYIPGISDGNGRTTIGYQALSVIKQKVITSQQWEPK